MNHADRIAKLRAMAADERLTDAARAAYTAKADLLESRTPNVTVTSGGREWLSLSHEDLIWEMGYEPMVSEYVGDYQGDALFAVRDGLRWGLLICGYGSCSGCDGLQAACDEGRAAVDELRESYRTGIVWHGSHGELLRFLRDRDWGAAHYLDREEVTPFIDAVAGLIKAVAA